MIMAMVHRYGEACREGDLPAVGLLYSEIVRALDDQDDEIGPDSVPKDEAGGRSGLTLASQLAQDPPPARLARSAWNSGCA